MQELCISSIISLSLLSTSSLVQLYPREFCAISKPETATPPAFEALPGANNTFLDLNIFIAIIQDKERLRFIIEKLTELSVNSISIGPTEHSQKLKINSEKLEKWSISAVEQSGNAFKPEIYLVDKLDFKKFKHAFDISGENIKNNLDQKDIAIGPEGGWSDKEIENFDYISKIADFTLRTETASILGVSLLM